MSSFSRKRTLFVLALTSALFGLSRRSFASPADVFGVGVRNQGLGSTGAAVGGGYSATYGNPALLAKDAAQRVAIGYQTARFSATLTDSQGTKTQLSIDALRALMFGLQLPLPFHGALEDRLVLGVAAVVPEDALARVRLLVHQPTFPLLGDRTQSLNLAFGMGVKITPELRLGIGVLTLAELTGSIQVADDQHGTLASTVNDELKEIVAPVVGAAYEIGALRLGASYRGELRSDFDLELAVQDASGIVLPPLHIAGVGQFDPAAVQFEVGFEQHGLTLVSGVLYRHWAAFPGFLGPTVTCPASRPQCTALKAQSADFHDTYSPRLGAAYRLPLSSGVSAELRLGGFFEPSPMPRHSASANTFDTSRYVLTAGYGLDFEKSLLPLKLDLAFQQHFSNNREQGAFTAHSGAQLFSLSAEVPF
ncbi:MAG TPA: outer membrane protein transport protein [Polyangiaceae bacterium]|nr:outer membrane protein transport protein [Polyangiaceae bacterium]